jgi:hypothetical protein
VLNGKRDLKTINSEAQNPSKKTVAAKKHSTGAITCFSLEANGSLVTPIKHCFARICCRGSLLHILIEITLSSQMALAAISLAENS